MNQATVLFGTLGYEFRMQIRRRAVWITLILMMCLLLSLRLQALAPLFQLGSYPLKDVLVQWVFAGNRLLPIGIGVLLADRLPRDRHTKVEELFTTMPAALSSRVIGKYLGSMLATLVPVFAFYMIGVGYILFQAHNIMALPLSFAVFAVVTLPGILFISAFSIACPAIMWVPLYQFFFVGYYFWGNELSPRYGIPTLSDTIFTPTGKYMAQGIFGVNLSGISATPSNGVASMLVLVGLAIFVLFVLWGYLKWQQARQ
ncbi:MAG TPA: hypothetical protein VHZ51_08325 [Ktedonobacteraceae bacterium]|jgi:hypothetical protein|nr:hypothetical protein [Ktedonobacteraceae bacterium]